MLTCLPSPLSCSLHFLGSEFLLLLPPPSTLTLVCPPVLWHAHLLGLVLLEPTRALENLILPVHQEAGLVLPEEESWT